MYGKYRISPAFQSPQLKTDTDDPEPSSRPIGFITKRRKPYRRHQKETSPVYQCCNPLEPYTMIIYKLRQYHNPHQNNSRKPRLMREIIHIISFECTGRLVGARAVQHNQSEADQQNGAGQQVIIIKIRRKFFLPLFLLFFLLGWHVYFLCHEVSTSIVLLHLFQCIAKQLTKPGFRSVVPRITLRTSSGSSVIMLSTPQLTIRCISP